MEGMCKVAAVILAAGKGGRIGCPKLALELGGVPFWMMIVQRLRKAGIRDIALVVRRSRKGRLSDSRIMPVVNYHPKPGMFSSVQAGLRRLPGFAGYIICPVDHPGVETGTYRRLLKRFCGSPDSVVRPRYRGASGHPVVVPGSVRREILKLSPAGRLVRAIGNLGLILSDVAVADRNVLLNINTKRELSDADRLRGKNPRRGTGE
jgi:CTP:molybdopterin cytidylyltransferase MocA